MKIYTQEEIDALNVFLKNREAFLEAEKPVFVNRLMYIISTPEGDYMARKEGDNWRKMFGIESWKRFNWGERPLRKHEFRPSKVHYRDRPYADRFDMSKDRPRTPPQTMKEAANES